MPTITQLETRLKQRLGLAAVTALATSRVTEAVNAGIARAYADGVPGLAVKVVVGYTAAQLTATISAHSANTASVTVDDLTEVYPRDVVDIEGREYLVHSVNRTSGVFSVGVPILSAVTGTVTFTRRSIRLPEAGTVLYVGLIDSTEDYGLEPNGRAFLLGGFNTGTPRCYAVGFAENEAQTYVSLAPAPSAGTAVAVHYLATKDSQLTGNTVLDMPETVVDAVLERARKAYLDWSGPIGQVEALTAANAQTEVRSAERTTASSARAARVRG